MEHIFRPVALSGFVFVLLCKIDFFILSERGKNLTSNIGNVKSFSKNFKKAHRPNFSLSNVEI